MSMNDIVKTLLVIDVLMTIIQIILIMSVVHVSVKSNEIADELRSINEKLYRIAGNNNASSEIRSSEIKERIEDMGTASEVRVTEKSWFCPECGTENPLTEWMCKECGIENPLPSWTCPECGIENLTTSYTCSNCGCRQR